MTSKTTDYGVRSVDEWNSTPSNILNQEVLAFECRDSLRPTDKRTLYRRPGTQLVLHNAMQNRRRSSVCIVEIEPRNRRREGSISPIEISKIRKKSIRADVLFIKRNSGQKLLRVRPDDTDQIPFEDMGTLVVLTLILFVIFIHCFAEWEQSQ